jgi:hypothetical protein
MSSLPVPSAMHDATRFLYEPPDGPPVALIRPGMSVVCHDGKAGTIAEVHDTHNYGGVTHLTVRSGWLRLRQQTVPIEVVTAITPDSVIVNLTCAELASRSDEMYDEPRPFHDRRAA